MSVPFPVPVIHIIINSVKGREGGEKMSENKLKSRDAIDAELKKTKARSEEHTSELQSPS